MYTTTRKPMGDTVITCKDCGQAISMNKICEKPIQSATDMLKHIAAHNASRAFATAERVLAPEPNLAVASATPPFASHAECPQPSDHTQASMNPTGEIPTADELEIGTAN